MADVKTAISGLSVTANSPKYAILTGEIKALKLSGTATDPVNKAVGAHRTGAVAEQAKDAAETYLRGLGVDLEAEEFGFIFIGVRGEGAPGKLLLVVKDVSGNWKVLTKVSGQLTRTTTVTVSGITCDLVLSTATD